MTWWQRLIEFLMQLFRPPTPPVKPPTDPPPDPQPGIVRRFPSGNIKTKGPGGRDLSHISWSTVSRWDPLFAEAEATEKPAFDRLLLECFAVIESEGNHYTTGGLTGRDQDVIRGHGDPRSRGLLQIRHDLHDPQMTQLGSAAHIRLGTQLLSQWIKSEGSWEAALANKWHPGTDPVSQTTRDEYIRTVRDLIAEVKASWDIPPVTPPSGGQPSPGKNYAVAGLANPVVLPFPLRQAIIPVGQTRQRPGIKITPDRYIQHDTGNRNPGMGARSHKDYLHSGAPDNYGNSQTLSYHFTVDDKEAWQMIPFNEIAWANGDGAGPCNYKGVSCELCINSDIDEAKSRENAEILCAELMNAGALVTLNKHQDCSGKFCPQDMLQDGYWPRFVQRVSALRKERKR
jgi:hypothetical protein